MNEFVFPCSPNWFLSSITSGNEAGLYAFGAMNHVYVYDVSELNQASTQSHQLGQGNSTDLPHKLPKLISCYTEHELKISSLCLSPDPVQLTCCSADETLVKLWDILSCTTIQTHSEHKEKITCMTWSPCDNDLVLTASEKGTVVLWKLKSNTVTSCQPLKDYVLCMTASPHSASIIALGYHSSVILIINIGCDQPYVMQKLRGIDSDVTSICWCPLKGKNWLDIAEDGDSGTLIAGAGGKLIKIWNSVTGNEVFYKKMPYSAYRVNFQDPVGKKLWLDIQWPKSSPDYLISSASGAQGDLFLWNLQTRTQQEPELFDSTNINKHSRLIFNITFVGDKICTFSVDRIIAVWDLKSRQGLISWCSFAGHVYCIRASPVDPGMVAIGAGDNAIRVWNQNNKSRPFDISSISYGVRLKITAVAWHPEREGLLAYGTDDGRVGIINTLTVKPPLMSNTLHKRTVYVVCWGPPVRADSGSQHYQVYSVGDGTVLQHFIDEHGSKKKAVNLIDAIHAVNGLESENLIRSEIAWRRDYTTFAVGCENGSVNVYSFPGLRQVCAINIHHKIIGCVRWHPETTAESVRSSPCKNWLAFAGNDRQISVVDLPRLFVGAEASSFSPVTITEAFCQLPGHLTKTTDLCWSPHHDGRLVSTGYDRTAIVWNVKTGEGLASYTEHNDRLLTVLWSYLDPDLIITGACDATVRVWRISAQSKAAIDAKERKKKRKKTSYASIVPRSAEPQQGGKTASEQDITELQDLLMAKRQQLLLQMQSESDATEKSAPENYVPDVPDSGCSIVTEGKPLSTTAVVKEPRYMPPHKRASTASDSTTTTTTITTGSGTPSTSLPTTYSSSVVTNNGSGIICPSTAPGTSPSSQFPSTHRQRSPAVSEKRNLPTEPVGVAGGKEDEKSYHDADDDAVDDYTKIPSVSDLVPPVGPLFFKSGIDTSSSKPAQASSLASAADVSDKAKKKKQPRAKSLFPVSSSATNRGKAAQHEDILDLSRIIAGQGSADIVDSKPHLGLFTDRLGAHRCLLQESEHHLSHGNMENHLQLELWRGNVDGAIQIARQRNELSDWIVAMAPLASHDLWELVSAEYAEQLEDDGQYHKAVTYLLAAHKVHQAIDLFRRHKLFKEAVSLARIRLSPVDPILEDLYTEWGQMLMRDGQYELAAKCYLAVRHIQEAEKALTKRHDHSSLKTACHMTLIVSDKQQGLVYGYKVFSQYLMMGEWQEAFKFISEYESLKILLPIFYTHELLIQHLTALCPSVTLIQKQLSPDMFSQWDMKEVNKKRELPEFLLDKSEIDPVVPWEPVLLGEHTFPHHVLRVWHQQLDITTLTQERQAIHTAISQLVPHRQTLADLPSLLVQVSVDVTLCLLSLLTSETSSAIIHLLQAMSTLHQANHMSVQQALCRLMLPQGPKYLLKLQQEFNASRVLVTMETHGDLDKAGGESHNSIKKFLTDMKDDSAISTSGVRCRELDCLRAYCYLAILDFLRENFPCAQNENDSLDGMPNGQFTPNSQNNITTSNIAQKCTPEDDEIKSRMKGEAAEGSCGLRQIYSSPNISKVENAVMKGDAQKIISDQNLADLDQNGKLNCSDDSSALHQPLAGNGDASQVISGKDCDRWLACDDSTDKSVLIDASCNKSLSQEPGFLLSSFSTSKLSISKPSKLSPESSSVDPPVPSNVSLTKVSASKSAANGTVLPDAKSTLSQSHNSPSSPLKSAAGSSGSLPGEVPEVAISLSPTTQTMVKGHLNYFNLLRLSKGILWDIQAKREALTETLGYVHQAISQHLLFNRSANDNSHCDPGSQDLSPSLNYKSAQQTVNSDHEEDGGCHRTRLLSSSRSTESELANIACERSGRTSSLNSLGLEYGRSVTPLPTVNAEDVSHRSPIRSLSETYLMSSSISQKLENSLVLQVEQDLLGPLKSEPMAFQKSRKVLWMDGKEISTDTDPANSKSTFQITKLAPDGSPIPLDWDVLPVDIKYSMPYVTLPLLKQEQDSISQELKRVPDASRIPFPATFTSVKKLLHTSLRSPHLSLSEKRSYFKQLNDWATVFAVTIHQQNDMEALFAAAATEYLTEG